MAFFKSIYNKYRKKKSCRFSIQNQEYFFLFTLFFCSYFFSLLNVIKTFKTSLFYLDKILTIYGFNVKLVTEYQTRHEETKRKE